MDHDYRVAEMDCHAAPHVVMPIGGIGTGNMGLAADGGLRQWQLHNIGNHQGALPDTFFAIRATRIEPPVDVVRILQAHSLTESTETPLVTDDLVPVWQRNLLSQSRGVTTTRFGGTYPFAHLRYLDDELPVGITAEAFNPLVPFDVDASSLPAAMFTFRITNTDRHEIHGALGATLQNSVGWDGVSPIDGVSGAGYGGNTNRLLRHGGWTSVVLENSGLDSGATGAGQMVLAADDTGAAVLPQWRDPAEFLAFLNSRTPANGIGRLAVAPGIADPQLHGPRSSAGASTAGQTWNAGMAVPFVLEPGEERVIRVAMTWHFPNRYVNFEQFGPARPEWGRSRLWLGNHYATVHADAQHVLRRVSSDWDSLREASARWTATLARSDLDDTAVQHLAAQLATIRSPTCFRTADGRFFGFEGVRGASTAMWSSRFGGSCPLNCTHVWNYEHALAKTFPELARNMRETEFDVMQAPEGYLPHRVIVPTFLPQLWDQPIGGPVLPALDGMLGTVLKAYREYRNGAGDEWLGRYWPRIRALLTYVDKTWNVTGTGTLHGVQPSTHDIDLCGLNPFMGTWWLAALRAGEEMARQVQDSAAAAHYRATFDRGSNAYDEALFNGEYYVQRLDPGEDSEFQWVDGCLADQLIGQWWAHQLDLGYLLPEEHVQSALRAIVRYNLRDGFREFDHGFRVFADQDDAGLLMCTWPRGHRPGVPIRYADEVWTGSEYQVAAHCLWEGLAAEGRQVLDAVWARYDGTRRNPYNEIECGDHYARSLAGWTVLEAGAGFRHDASLGSFTFRSPSRPARVLPFVASSGWGLFSARDGGYWIECTGGSLDVAVISVENGDGSRTRKEFPGGVRLTRSQSIDVTSGT